MESKSVSVQIKTFSGTDAIGCLDVDIFSPQVVWRRTIIRTTIVGVVTFLCVFIPLLHLIMLPLGIALTLATFFHTQNTKAMIKPGSLPCPACQKTITINSRRLVFPFKDSCEHCHREVVITES
jgi:hypothetical protein